MLMLMLGQDVLAHVPFDAMNNRNEQMAGRSGRMFSPVPVPVRRFALQTG